ncbi:MAG: hypothetical protein J0L92_03585 [Deltaproteobacteria bacterium]|nr:hypothetical protein [Deltaproteobacteria bacterium]
MDELMSWLGHPSTWITVLIVGTLGEVAKALILGPKKTWPKDADGHVAFRGWRGVYAVTYKVHALVVGALFGLVPGVPVIEALHSEGVAGAVLQYAGNGALAMVTYTSVVGTLKSLFEMYGGPQLRPKS